MSFSAALPGQTALPPASDYAFLRQEGLRHLEALAGGEWTDFNAHDPGVTILEQFCYALTELAYRIGYDIEDLLADGEGAADSYRCLPGPAAVLATEPVTPADFRKALIDLAGVRNAWIEPVDSAEPPVYLDPADGSLYLEAAPHREALAVRGVFRVLIAADGSQPDTNVADTVNRRLHGCRGLGQEFLPARILPEQRVWVDARIEIGATEDGDQVRAAVLLALSRFIAPRVRFRRFSELRAEGRPVDGIFDGPPLRRGFIDTGELERFGRATGLRVSDLIREVMDAPGVVAVDRMAIGTGDKPPDTSKLRENWYLELDPESTPVLDDGQSSITLLRGGVPVLTDTGRVQAILRELRESDRPEPLPDAERDIRPAPGRDRRAGRYHSIQHQFPEVYGLGPFGLPASATPLRRAQARQLQAYLLFFDQLLANGFAQLSNAKSLLSFDPDAEVRSYFCQPVVDPRLDLEPLWVDPEGREDALRKITENPETALRRKDRFLNHLLARFAEDFADFHGAGAEATEQRIKAKSAFLWDYRRLGVRRGAGLDCASPGAAESLSGLAGRLAGKLGLPLVRPVLADQPESGEGGFHLVEHLLLRPRDSDRKAADPEAEVGGSQSGVLLALPEGPGLTATADPFSQRISLVLPDWIARFREPDFRDFFGHLLREEAPAHLQVQLVWLSREQMAVFERAQRDWLEHLDTLWLDGGNLAVRDARDRLLQCLGLGTPYPLRDVPLEYDRVVALDQPAQVRITAAQAGVRYRLCDENGDPWREAPGESFSAYRKPGQSPDEAILPLPAIVKDIGFTVLATREASVFGELADSPLETYLVTPVSVKAGIDTRLRAGFEAAEGQVADGARITVNYGETAQAFVEASQQGISYVLVLESGGQEKPVSAPAKGDKARILLTATETFLENTTLRVKAYRTLAAADFQYLNQILAVLVRPNPQVAAVAASGVLGYGARTSISLDGVQETVSYRLYRRDLVPKDYPETPSADPKAVENTADRTDESGLTAVGDFVRKRGKYTIETGPLNEDALFRVEATHRENGERLWLGAAVVVLVRPSTAPPIGVLAESVPTGTEGVVTVSGTQRGVMYRLFEAAANTPVNAPGYHWEERAIGTARIEVDWVVEAPDDPERYRTLYLPTGNLPAATEFKVVASKRLTGLDATLSGTVKIGVGDPP